MKINKGFKYRLYPEEKQITILNQMGGNCRFIWNKFVEFYFASKELTDIKFLNRDDFQKYLLYLKDEYDFLAKSYSQSIQYESTLVDRTIKRAFDKDTVKQRTQAIAKAMAEEDETKRNKKLAKAYNYGFPKYHKKQNFDDSFTYTQNFQIKKSRIYLPKIGWINFEKHRVFEGKLRNVTVSKDGIQWYVSLNCEIIIQDFEEQSHEQLRHKNIVGGDLGLKTFLTLSDGTTFNAPKTLKDKEKKLKRYQRSLARMQYDVETKKSSNRYKRQQLRIRKIHQVIENIRNDFLHKVSDEIVKSYDGIILESLAVKNMVKNHCLAKSISNVSWSKFVQFLLYKSIWNGKYFEQIDRFFASSQICSNEGCGHRQAMPLETRTFVCEKCGFVTDRDLNAAINIRRASIIFLQLEELMKTTDGMSGSQGQGETAMAVSMNCQKEQNQLDLGSPWL